MGKSKKITVGWRYYLGMHMVLCNGPVDTVESISFGERAAWNGDVTSSGQIFVNSPNLFGGDKREGGVSGVVDIMMGEAGQGANGYLAAVQGPNQPAYRGVLSLVFRNFYVAANNPYVKPVAFKVRRILQGWDTGIAWNAATASVGIDMNPIHIIYECLTNAEWGMGYPASSLDETQMAAASAQLLSEGFGLSIKWEQQAKIEDFIGEILDHIGANLVVDSNTGLFQVKLLRFDYTPGTLPVYDENNIVEVSSFQRPTWGETVNEIVLNYTSADDGSAKTIVVHDIANISVQGSIVSESRNYRGIRSDNIAAIVAQRDLRLKSTPLARVSFTVNRTAWGASIGDVISFNWDDYGISAMSLRIIAIDLGEVTDNTITIDGVEDVFGIGNTTYLEVQPAGWTDPNQPPVTIANAVAFEMPYYEIATTLSEADLAFVDTTSAFFGVVAERPSSTTYEYNLHAGLNESPPETDDVDESGEFCPTAILGENISYNDTTSIEYNSAMDIEFVSGDTWAFMDNEVFEVVSIDLLNSTIDIKRGILDSVPQEHAIGSKMWFAGDFFTTDSEEHLQGQRVYGRLPSVSAFGAQTIASSKIVSVDMGNRQYKPYPPGRVRIAGQLYPPEFTGPTIVTWVGRNRLAQTVGFVDFTEGHITEEPGTTYQVSVYNASNGLIHTVSGLTNIFTYTAAMDASDNHPEFVRFDIYAIRSGLASNRYTSGLIHRTGLGLNLGGTLQ